MPDEKATWQVILERQPKKILRRLPRPLLKRIQSAMWELADDPHPPDSKKLVGYNNLYRIRIGSWRVVYAVEDDRLIILVIRIAPRGSAYHNI